jgi:uncharacterized protein involved in exopolysaccharide biosynthesis
MRSLDPRLPAESELRTVQIRGEQLDVADSPSTQIWALYPLASPGEQRPAPPSVDLLKLVPEVAQRSRRLLLIGGLVGFCFGAAYLLWTDSIYVVKTLLHVEQRKSVIRDSDTRPPSTFVGTQAEVIQSPTMVAEAIRTIGLPEADEPGLLDTLRGWVDAINPFYVEPDVDPVAQAVLATLPVLQASPVLGTEVLAVTLRTDNPERGVSFLDALVASFQHYVRENEVSAHQEGLDLLRQREQSLAAQIAEVVQLYEQKESSIRSFGVGEDAFTVQRMSLEEHARARVEAQRRRIELENELSALREQRNAEVAPSREIMDEVVRGEARLAELRDRLSDRHPDVIQLEQRVAGLREQIRAGGRSRIEQLEREVRAARRSESAHAGLYDREWEKVKQLEVERSGLKKLGDELSRLEEERRGLLALMGEKELSVLAARGGENSGTLVRVLQAPSIPPDAVWPLPLPVLVSCSFVGVLGGLAFALFSYWREHRAPASEATDYQETGHSRVQRRLQEL